MIKAKSYLLGDRIDTKSLEKKYETVAIAPLTIQISDNGYIVLFKYGVIVSFGLDDGSCGEFIQSISNLVSGGYSETISEEASIIVSKENKEDIINKDGDILLCEFNVLKAQLIAGVMAEATVLNYYEARANNVLDLIEPKVNMLNDKGKIAVSGKSLSKIIADILLTSTKLVGRVGIGEKPDILWDNQGLERFYSRLADEYELVYRDNALNRRLDLMSRAMETLLGVGQHRYSARLEWYVILLIVAEVVIMLASEVFK